MIVFEKDYAGLGPNPVDLASPWYFISFCWEMRTGKERAGKDRLIEIAGEDGFLFAAAEEFRLRDDEIFIFFEAVGVAIGTNGDFGGDDGIASEADFVGTGLPDDLIGPFGAIGNSFKMAGHLRGILIILKNLASLNKYFI